MWWLKSALLGIEVLFVLVLMRNGKMAKSWIANCYSTVGIACLSQTHVYFFSCKCFHILEYHSDQAMPPMANCSSSHQIVSTGASQGQSMSGHANLHQSMPIHCHLVPGSANLCLLVPVCVKLEETFLSLNSIYHFSGKGNFRNRGSWTLLAGPRTFEAIRKIRQEIQVGWSCTIGLE